ncbi:hypothetical protein [Halolamina rubra]|uniref:hypothetical protein n=1 Tax=Halolamina rubra TaxID=1380430 RepID=UPI0012AC3A84|nr:hypothetical protein [Halolamina rubra]
MVPTTRRSLLSGVAGVAAALAGCGGDGAAGSTRTVPADGDGPSGPMSGSTTDPETHLVRIDTDRPPVWLTEPDDDDRPTASRRDRWRDSIIVDDADRADRIRLADGVDAEPVESFLDATEFDAESVFVEMGDVRECFRLELCHVAWSATEISTDYSRRSRPYTAHCEVDEWVVEARFIRIPDPIDADEVTTYSSSIGTGTCDRSETASTPSTHTATPSDDGGEQ